jgi:hypothetical protein
MDYMMNRSFVFMEESAAKAINCLQNSSAVIPHDHFASAALLDRQIKVAINHLLEEYIGDLFEGVEKKLRRNRASFAICFCTNLILCILVEHVQIAIDAIVIDKVSNGQDAHSTRKMGIEICEALEELPMKYSWSLFEGIERKYNPIKRCSADNGSGQNQGEAALVDSIRQLMYNRGIPMPQCSDEASANIVLGDEISGKVADSSCLGGASESPADHQSFRIRNSGRHVSRFLRKFC